MPDDRVTHYWLNYDIQKKSVRISVKTDARGWQIAAELQPHEALFLSDMLRNEEPVFLGTTDDGRPTTLHTREEETGEGERK